MMKRLMFLLITKVKQFQKYQEMLKEQIVSISKKSKYLNQEKKMEFPDSLRVYKVQNLLSV